MEHLIAHACGHEQVHLIPGHPAQRERKANWLRTTSCRACFAAGRQAERASAAAGDAAAVAGMALAELAGSERQVAWAITIRARRLAGLLASPAFAASLPEHRCVAVGDAKWWIDHRDLGDAELLHAAERHAGGPAMAAMPRAA